MNKNLKYFSSQPKEVEKSSPPKKNFYTNPTKQGTGYGYPNVTIGKMPPYFLEDEYEKLKENKEKLVKPALPKLKPFKAGVFQQGYFDSNPFHADVDRELHRDEERETTEVVKPFFPTGPAKQDGGMKDGCLNTFPKYVGDSYTNVVEENMRAKDYVNEEMKRFRYVPGPKPYPIKSIITKNVERKVTPKNFTAIKGVVYYEKGISHSNKN